MRKDWFSRVIFDSVVQGRRNNSRQVRVVEWKRKNVHYVVTEAEELNGETQD